jgi:hypothetical protein
MQEKKRSRALFPVMGLLLAVALGAIAWFVTPAIMEWQAIPANIRGLLRNLPGLQGELAVAAALFVTMLAIVSIIVAIATPKKAINVKDTDILREREQMIRDRNYKQVQAQRIAQENRKVLRAEDAERRKREK